MFNYKIRIDAFMSALTFPKYNHRQQLFIYNAVNFLLFNQLFHKHWQLSNESSHWTLKYSTFYKHEIGLIFRRRNNIIPAKYNLTIYWLSLRDGFHLLTFHSIRLFYKVFYRQVFWKKNCHLIEHHVKWFLTLIYSTTVFLTR